MIVLRAGSATDVGLVRRTNQDALVLEARLFAVADGMGGHVGGGVASRAAVDALSRAFAKAGNRPVTADDLASAVQEANTAVFERSLAEQSLRGMGTTLTAAALVSGKTGYDEQGVAGAERAAEETAGGEAGEDGDRVAVANVGDSRVYVFSQGELTQLTEDHSVPEELVRLGQLEPDEVELHPHRHILTRVLGVLPEVDVDVWELTPYAGDRLLLCSDGLVRDVSDEQIAAVLRRLADPSEAAKELVARARDAGGSDNITVIVVDVADDEGRALADSAAVRANEDPGVRGHTPTPPAVPTTAPAPPDEPAAAPSPGAGPPSPRPRRGRMVTWRVAAFVVVLGIVLGGGAGAVVVYARASYYVGLTRLARGEAAGARDLAIYQGRPGGLLWFHPTLVERWPVREDAVAPARRPDVERGKTFASLAAARAYIIRLEDEAVSLGLVAPGGRAGTNTPTTGGAASSPK